MGACIDGVPLTPKESSIMLLRSNISALDTELQLLQMTNVSDEEKIIKERILQEVFSG